MEPRRRDGETLLKGTYSSGVKTEKGSRTVIINQQLVESGGIKSRMKAYLSLEVKRRGKHWLCGEN